MNNLKTFLAFLLVLMAMIMAYPERGKAATLCLISLMKAMPIGKFFEVLIKYFTRNNKSRN